MKLSTIYRKAARELHDQSAGINKGMCCAIERVADDILPAIASSRLLNETFADDARGAGVFTRLWGANWGAQRPHQKFADYDMEEAKRCRVLALLFMAAMAEELEEKK